MSSEKPNAIVNKNTRPVIYQDQKDPSEDGINNNRVQPGFALAGDVTESEVSLHMQAKVLKFMKKKQGTIKGAYTINDDEVMLKRVVILSYPNEITIIHTQEVIDGQLHESYLPETIKDLNLITKAI